MRVSSRPVVVLLFAAVCAAACDDALTGPPSALVAEEARAALRVAADLPTLPNLVERALRAGAGGSTATDSVALVHARALWLDAASAPDSSDADALRRSAYALAAPALGAALDTAELAEVRDRLERWIGMATGIAAADQFPGIGDALTTGRVLVDRARAAVARGDRTAAAAALLEAADRLAATTPPAVALRLIRRAERAWRADGAVESGDAEAGEAAENDGARDIWRERAGRLLRGAREAFDAGDYERAIRRAFYAEQVLRMRR
ncbi:MAG TPA: hypothetical protein VF188_07915 [Longimicrobiales bacterium]